MRYAAKYEYALPFIREILKYTERVPRSVLATLLYYHQYRVYAALSTVNKYHEQIHDAFPTVRVFYGAMTSISLYHERKRNVHQGVPVNESDAHGPLRGVTVSDLTSHIGAINTGIQRLPAVGPAPHVGRNYLWVAGRIYSRDEIKSMGVESLQSGIVANYMDRRFTDMKCLVSWQSKDAQVDVMMGLLSLVGKRINASLIVTQFVKTKRIRSKLSIRVTRHICEFAGIPSNAQIVQILRFLRYCGLPKIINYRDHPEYPKNRGLLQAMGLELQSTLKPPETFHNTHIRLRYLDQIVDAQVLAAGQAYTLQLVHVASAVFSMAMLSNWLMQSYAFDGDLFKRFNPVCAGLMCYISDLLVAGLALGFLKSSNNYVFSRRVLGHDYRELSPQLSEIIFEDVLNLVAYVGTITCVFVHGFNLDLLSTAPLMVAPHVFTEFNRFYLHKLPQPNLNLTIPAFSGISSLALYSRLRHGIRDHAILRTELECNRESKSDSHSFFDSICNQDREILERYARNSYLFDFMDSI